MATIYKANGEVVENVQPGNGKKFTLQEMQTAVGGYIEAVPATGHRAYCNEEGLLRGLQFNRKASERFQMRLVGDVFVLDPGDRQ